MDGITCRYWGYNPTAVGHTASTCGDVVTNKCGPKDWKAVEHAAESCAAAEGQSPIGANFLSAVVLPNSHGVSDLQLESPLTDCALTANFIVNGYTSQVDIPDTCKSAFKATWKRNGVSKVFNLHQYHFHTPSEHTVDGYYFEMEAQHVHKAADHAYLVIAVFLKANTTLKQNCIAVPTSLECKRADFLHSVLLGGQTEAKLLAQVANVPGPQTKVTNAAAVSFDPYKELIPPMNSYFFTYSGSGTTPPCEPGVTWILNPDVVAIYDTSVVLFRKILASFKDNQLGFGGTNNRDLQPMGSRKLYYVGQPVVKNYQNRYDPQATTTPSGTLTPIIPITMTPAATLGMISTGVIQRKFIQKNLFTGSEADRKRYSDALWLAVGGSIASAVLIVVWRFRSRIPVPCPHRHAVYAACPGTDVDE